jgi:DNA polymerase III subunit epsilon
MARDKPPARIVLPQFKNFVGDCVLVAWNAAFDMRFLELKQDEVGVRFDNPVLDALLLSIYVRAEPIDHSLMATAERLGVVVTGRHTALGDAMATAAIWIKLLDLLEARGIRTLGQAFKISRRLVAERRHLAQF